MSQAEEIRELIHTHELRLHGLLKKEALQGFDVDPIIPAEIKSIKQKIKELQAELENLQDPKFMSPDAKANELKPKRSQKLGMTIQEAIERYLRQIKRSKSPNTAVTYGQGLQAFATCLAEHEAGVDFGQAEVTQLSPLWLEPFLNDLQKQSVSTERLYTTAVAGFYRYVAAQEWASLNLSTLDFAMSQRRSQGKRLHIFPEGKVEYLLEYMGKLVKQSLSQTTVEKLTLYRDAALLIVLADTGLRVSEACNLRRGQLDWERNRAVIIGKGDKQAIVRFSEQALAAINAYLDVRWPLDQRQGRPDVLPIFARHDKRASKRVLPMSTRTAENIVSQRVVEALGPEARGVITPHTFRHYFVTRAARHQDILLAQHLARHESITTTSGYTHLTETEIDAAYAAVFDHQRQSGGARPGDGSDDSSEPLD
jgi:site-specific recombinase XerD